MRRSLTVGCLLLAAAACGPSPGETVDSLVEAVRARDSVTVARYIDVGRVAESAVDPLIAAATAMSQADPDRFRRQTGAVGPEVLEQLRPMIAPVMEQLFWQMMLDPEGLQQGPLGMMLGSQRLPFQELGEAYQGVVQEQRDGDEAIVSVELTNEAAGTPTVVVQLRLERIEGDWQVVGFENLSDVVAEALDYAGL
jgi:hypothetical protein